MKFSITMPVVFMICIESSFGGFLKGCVLAPSFALSSCQTPKSWLFN